MRSVADLKGLRETRTAISTHSRSTSRHKGTPYLEVLSLGMEKLRLETELPRLNKRLERIETRLGEIGQLLGERVACIQGGPSEAGLVSDGSRGAEGRSRGSVPRNLRTMTVDY